MTKTTDPEVTYIATALRNLDRMAGVFETLLPNIAQLALSHAVKDGRESDIPQRLDEIDSRLERIEKAAFLQYRQDKEKVRTVTGELWSDMRQEIISSIRRRLQRQIKNKNKLLEESANYGARPPLELTNQIIGVGEEIEKLKAELKSYEGIK